MGERCERSVILFGLVSISIISATSLCGALFAPFQELFYSLYFTSTMVLPSKKAK